MIQIYTGDGKGKTTAALGLSFRAAGHNLRVKFLAFLKDGDSGEFFMSESVPNIEMYCFKTTVPGFFWNMSEEEKKQLKIESEKGFSYAEKCIENCDVLVLDEIAGCISNGLISKNQVLSFLKKYGTKAEIILTGRDFPNEIVAVADYVSEVKEIKHPFHDGVLSRKGIEF